jgi:antimicrobial peptide system SdpB family protein
MCPVNKFDFRNIWFGAARTTLSCGFLLSLLATDFKYYFVPVIGTSSPQCGGIRAGSIVCLLDGTSHGAALAWFMMTASLAVVATGYRPRYTALLHLYATYSFSTSITLPDGGEAIGLIAVLLLTPLALMDNRRWHWSTPETSLAPTTTGIAIIASWAIRIQFAFIYAHATIAKFGVPEWAQGTAEYYFVRDPAFGDGGPLRNLSLWVTNFPIGTLALTWGVLVLELIVGFLALLPAQWRKWALPLDIVLHLGIALTIGLWSFAIVMVGLAVAVANPLSLRKSPDSNLSESADELQHESFEPVGSK